MKNKVTTNKKTMKSIRADFEALDTWHRDTTATPLKRTWWCKKCGCGHGCGHDEELGNFKKENKEGATGTSLYYCQNCKTDWVWVWEGDSYAFKISSELVD